MKIRRHHFPCSRSDGEFDKTDMTRFNPLIYAVPVAYYKTTITRGMTATGTHERRDENENKYVKEKNVKHAKFHKVRF